MACWSQGIDVYTLNTCDFIPGARFNYSPIILRFPHLLSDTGLANVFGLALAACFSVSMAWLPPPPRPAQLAVLLVACLSSCTVFALERANLDVAVFLLIFWGSLAITRDNAARLIGYGAILLAGLLKYYPLAAFLLVLREPPRVLVRLAATVIVALAAFFGAFHQEIGRAFANLPTITVFGDMVGAHQLRLGVSVMLDGMFGQGTSAVPRALITPASSVVCVAVAVMYGTGSRQRAALAALPARTGILLMAGAALMCGCFFAGDSVGYRGIFLLLVLPGLLALAEAPALQRRFITTIVAVLALMWSMAIMQAAAQIGTPLGHGIFLLAWLLEQAGWWWVVSQLLSLLVSFAVDSPTWRWLAGRCASAARRAMVRKA